MLRDERERPPPGVVGRLGELLLLAVEEAVRGAVVDDDLVLDACGRQRRVERGVVLGGDVPSSPAWSARIGTVDLRGAATGLGPPRSRVGEP